MVATWCLVIWGSSHTHTLGTYDSGRWQRRRLHFEGYHETQDTSVVVECGKGADNPGGQGTKAVYIEGQSIKDD